MPGNCPPSPGFAPCATLICSSSALIKYSAFTPKRPEATCLILLLKFRPSGSGLKRSRFSPPSPLFDFAPIEFMASAKHLCASSLKEP